MAKEEKYKPIDDELRRRAEEEAKKAGDLTLEEWLKAQEQKSLEEKRREEEKLREERERGEEEGKTESPEAPQGRGRGVSIDYSDIDRGSFTQAQPIKNVAYDIPIPRVEDKVVQDKKDKVISDSNDAVDRLDCEELKDQKSKGVAYLNETLTALRNAYQALSGSERTSYSNNRKRKSSNGGYVGSVSGKESVIRILEDKVREAEDGIKVLNDYIAQIQCDRPKEPRPDDDRCSHPDCDAGASYFPDATSSTGYRSCTTCQEVSIIPDNCKPPKEYCLSAPIGLGQDYYPDPDSPTGFRSCEECKPVEPGDKGEPCKPPTPPCTPGSNVGIYADPTSSTGWRNCSGCDEVSPINGGDGSENDDKDNNVHGDVIDIISYQDDTIFSGTTYQPQTLTYNEQVKGWTSFKTFYPESALSINNHYYTFSGGEMWQHHLNPRRNNFYGVDANSVVDLIFNDAPSSVKGFQTVKYEGTQSRVNKFSTVNVDGVEYTDKEYYNLTSKPGWYVSYIETDLQTGKIPEFINKEGKWFNFIKGDCTEYENVDEREFSVQGIGFGQLVHSDGNSTSPEIERKEIVIKDSGFDIDGTAWD